jgi:hypothetical protein
MMTDKEIKAFADAFVNNVASVPYETVIAFVVMLNAGDTDFPEFSFHYTSIVDALGMWHAGARFALIEIAEVL